MATRISNKLCMQEYVMERLKLSLGSSIVDTVIMSTNMKFASSEFYMTKPLLSSQFPLFIAS